MTSLQEYVARQFPNHEIDLWDAASSRDLELSDHTVVSQVVGTRDGLDLLNTFRRRAPHARVAALAVRPPAATVVQSDREDRDGVVDLPPRRIVTSVFLGAVVVGAVFTTVMLAMNESGATTAVAGGFAALVGAAIGAIVGASRLASQRANSQPQSPGSTITVVAAFLDDDASASTLAQSVGPVADYEIRIVDHNGGWRGPLDS
jgi:hypothetical protein